jgi:hypothetical protein
MYLDVDEIRIPAGPIPVCDAPAGEWVNSVIVEV